MKTAGLWVNRTAWLEHAGMLVRVCCVAVAVLLFARPAAAQINLGTGATVTQNFDSLASSGTPTWTNFGTITGWYAFQGTPGTVPATYTANPGSGTSGALYSYGSAASSDRALGSLVVNGLAPVGTVAQRIGAVFRNNEGVEVLQFHLAYTGEQWRNNGNVTPQTLTFDYLVGTGLTSAAELAPGTGFTAVTGLDFTSPIASATAGALDGNLPVNRTAKAASITLGASWTTGDLALRWSDVNDSGNDHGLAVDDFRFQAIRRLVWTGGTGGTAGQWNTTATNWKSGTTLDNSLAFANLDGAFAGTAVSDAGGDVATFTNAGLANPNITLTGTLRPTSVAVSNTSGTYTFSGAGSITGNGGLTKTGAGTLVIENANTYAGRTTISGGTLLANNAEGTSATGSGTVVVESGGTLGGTGFVTGTLDPVTSNLRNVELQAGGAIQPGSPSDPFNDLTLNGTSNSLFLPNSTLKINVGTSTTQSGRLTLRGSSGLDLTNLSDTAKLNIELTAVQGLQLDTQYTIIVVENLGTGSITHTDGFNANKFNITATNFVVSGGFAIEAVGMGGNQFQITFTPVPEPATVLGVAIAVLGVGGFVRRRLHKTGVATT